LRQENAVASASFATLVNNKICLPSPLKTHYSVDKFFLAECLREYIQKIYVDKDWYLSTYPDVAAAVARDPTIDAKTHYIKFGYFENRMPYPIKIDESWYRANYKDVEQAVNDRSFPSAQAHFDRVGYLEGRLPFAGFSLRAAEPA
jgi:hypothetical protein